MVKVSQVNSAHCKNWTWFWNGGSRSIQPPLMIHACKNVVLTSISW